jgi:hypothetical protein
VIELIRSTNLMSDDVLFWTTARATRHFEDVDGNLERSEFFLGVNSLNE